MPISFPTIELKNLKISGPVFVDASVIIEPIRQQLELRITCIELNLLSL